MIPTLALALAVGAPALKDKPGASAPLVGLWEVESATFAGRPRPQPAGAAPLRYEFRADGSWVLYRGERKVRAAEQAYFTDPKADPPAIDLRYDPADQDGRVVRGIYKVDGDRLTLCLARGEGPRPKAFEASAEAPATVYVMKRVKPKD